ncbi:MAG: TetR/AcrR family transcriptional regulator [Ilumatobacter sp.]
MPQAVSTGSSGSTSTMREAIVDAALSILHTEGAAALTVRNITEAAGCSTTGIYTHFGGKAGVIEAIYLDGFASFDAALAAAYDLDFIESGRVYRRWALEHPTQYMVMFGRAVPDFEPSADAAMQAAVAFDRLVQSIRKSGAFPDNEAELWAYHVFATVHGYVMLELSTGSSPVGDLEARYERMLVSMLLPSHESTPAGRGVSGDRTG